MNVRNLLRVPVIVVGRSTSSTERDEMGDPVVVDAAPVTFLGYLWQTQAAEDTENVAQQTETFRLALERSAAGRIDGSDRVTIGGTIDDDDNVVGGIAYEVIGTPHQATNPRTRVVEYLDMAVRRVR